ncbi:MAG: hypothetical protein ACD_79C01391G0006 [uncultured bacterium]|nr:MAG: hypothetical protein ACD_79C01391G0006 [uncultured bacterium]
MNFSLKLYEIFSSIQGESSFAGIPFTFIRLSGCPLRCRWCDTKYAYNKGKIYTLNEILKIVEEINLPHVMITGGEPLMQKNCAALIRILLKEFTVVVETSGAFSLKGLPRKAHYIVDVKTPSSGMSDKIHPHIFNKISKIDEIKFVIANRNDYEFSKEIINKYPILKKRKILMSTVFNKLKPQELARWIVDDKLNVRFQLQLHKYIWGPKVRGV